VTAPLVGCVVSVGVDVLAPLVGMLWLRWGGMCWLCLWECDSSVGGDVLAPLMGMC
jgi:hypothetical protein